VCVQRSILRRSANVTVRRRMDVNGNNLSELATSQDHYLSCTVTKGEKEEEGDHWQLMFRSMVLSIISRVLHKRENG
jgi:hypothetical protein